MERPTTSTRDLDVVLDALSAWLAGQLGLPCELVPRAGPVGAGLSSETIVFGLVGEVDRDYVLRLPPPPDAFPLFPRYELDRQARALRAVHRHGAVPVPAVPWFEPDPAPLGAPFFVMERIDGQPVPDIPPYVFGSWLTESTPEELVRVGAGMVEVLAGVHDVPVTGLDLELTAPGAGPLVRHVANQRSYYEWIRGGERFPLIEAAFAWLDRRWPATEGPAVLSWGDARLANVLWRAHRPVAVLDWEAVAVGPRELDLGWAIFFHEYFQRIAVRYGHPGLPELLRRDEVVTAYEARTGHTVEHLDWYLVYAELRQALTSIRVSSRAVHFGERPAPDDLQDLILERSHLEEVLSR